VFVMLKNMKIKTVTSLFPLVILLITVSCVTTYTPESRAEYYKGSNMGRKYAKTDAMNLNYVRSRTRPQKYEKLLQEQGRSEPFKRGFYYGYDESYMEFVDLYYGP
jgi:hypothetical protein